VCLWNNEILGPIQKHALNGPGRDAFRKLRILLDRMMLRRTKVCPVCLFLYSCVDFKKLERADDLGLPPRTVIVRRDYFSPEEKELYLSLFSDAKRQFSTYVDSGTLLNSCVLYLLIREYLIPVQDYSNIFTLITRMRQMVRHPTT
jgi:DNA repair protein RAD16